MQRSEESGTHTSHMIPCRRVVAVVLGHEVVAVLELEGTGSGTANTRITLPSSIFLTDNILPGDFATARMDSYTPLWNQIQI